MAERGSLKRKNRIVNQPAAFGAILFLAACGGSEEAPVNNAPESLSAQIIWQSENFDSDLSSLSVSPAGASVFLIGQEQVGLKLTNIDGEATSEAAPYHSVVSSNGILANIEGADLVLFPGISRNSDKLVVFVHGEGLIAPIEIELSADVTGSVQGICASQSKNSEAILDIGFWTTIDRNTLYTGSLIAAAGEFNYVSGEAFSYEENITSCALTSNATVAGGRFGLDIRSGESEPVTFELPGVPTSLSALADQTDTFVAMAMSGGEVYVADGAGNFSEVTFEAGLSAGQPTSVGYIALSERTDLPGFSEGFLALESRDRARGSQIVLADYNRLFDQLSAE